MFRTKSNIYDGDFFTLVKPYFKNVLNLLKLPLGSIFYTTYPFVKKKLPTENSGEKVFCQQWDNFLLKLEIMQWNSVITKKNKGF